MDAKEVLILVNGHNKAEALRAVVEGPTVVGGTQDPSGGGRVTFGRKRE